VNGVLITVWLCAAIAIAVFAAMIVSIVRFGGPLGDCPPASVSGKATEILWALIPIAIVLAAAMPAVRTVLVTAPISQTGSQPAIWGGVHPIVGYALNKK
jgi:heme/copper-type cytochrome/quinol oxidase subunit 2